MEIISKHKGWIMVAAGLILLVVLILININKAADDQVDNSAVSAVESETSQDAEAEPQNESDDVVNDDEETATEPAKDTYTYVAQPGDSYSVLARKAVQSYGIVENVDLRRAQIIAAETRLTLDAGSVELNEGQEVTIASADVIAAIEAVQDIPDDEMAAWQVYVANVEFDTSRNGEEA